VGTADSGKIRVAVVEDNIGAGRSMSQIIENSRDFTLTGWYTSAEDALTRMPGRDVDIMIVDIGLPGISGLDLILRVKEGYPFLKPVVYTIFEDEKKIIQAIRNGAKGYILKDTPPELFLAELNVISLGGAPMTPRIADKIIGMFSGVNLDDDPQSPDDTGLTDREKEILSLVALGLTYNDIAGRINISGHTVRRHIEKIYQKLDVHTRSEALDRARKEGLIV
jgi:two-component system NarL family response regulator